VSLKGRSEATGSSIFAAASGHQIRMAAKRTPLGFDRFRGVKMAV
jgi:hypothetical protein